MVRVSHETFKKMDKGTALLYSIRIYMDERYAWHAECSVCRQPVEINVYTGAAQCTNHTCWCGTKVFAFYPVRRRDGYFIDHANKLNHDEIEWQCELLDVEFIGFLFDESMACFEDPFSTFRGAVDHYHY